MKICRVVPLHHGLIGSTRRHRLFGCSGFPLTAAEQKYSQAYETSNSTAHNCPDYRLRGFVLFRDRFRDRTFGSESAIAIAQGLASAATSFDMVPAVEHPRFGLSIFANFPELSTSERRHLRKRGVGDTLDRPLALLLRLNCSTISVAADAVCDHDAFVAYVGSHALLEEHFAVPHVVLVLAYAVSETQPRQYQQ